MMNRVLILGSSGSGKSSLAIKLSNQYNIPVLHLDKINFDSGWILRDRELFNNDLIQFLKKDQYIIDGNYSSSLEHRLTFADTIFFLNFNRFICLYGALKRYLKYKNKARPSMTEGCNEKIDLEFIKWILWVFPRKKKQLLRLIKGKFKGELLIFSNRKHLNKYLMDIGVEI